MQPKPQTVTIQQAIQIGLDHHQAGRLAEAEDIYRRVLQVEPNNADALQFLGIIAYQAGKHALAVDLFDQALSSKPDYAEALSNRGLALQELKRYDEACASYARALSIRPDYAEAWCNRGNALLELKRYDAALADYDRALSIKPDYAEALRNRGNALLELKRYDAALADYDQALSIRPGDADALNNRGKPLQELRRYDEALASYDRALLLKPDSAEALNNRGLVLVELKRCEEALASYVRALALKPDFAEALSNRGLALHELGRYDEALASYEQALALAPGYVEALVNRGDILQAFKRHDEALASFDKALSIDPAYPFLLGMLLHAKMRICDWAGMDQRLAQLAAGIGRGEPVCFPLVVLAIDGALNVQRKAAEIMAREKYPAARSLPAVARRPRHEKIRLGYFSADYHDHATAYLMAELFERHDRAKFELIAFSFGLERNGAMRRRVAAGFDKFLDVRTQSDKDVAQLSRSLQIDIAVDLKGYTKDCRTGLFASRLAPVQVNYLGYPGTMGADYIDYLIADPTLIPPASRPHYAEKIVYLPGSYQVNDGKRRISERAFDREELGLPQKGFVFCCFNNNYKITRATFDGWMRILKRVEGSVLWLFEDNPAAARNLSKEAVLRGVSEERLVFARHMPLAEHLARHRLADLFLDTLPYNAHTTASDALWAGLPVLTCSGEAFAGRVAASLLNAMQLPELISATQEDYEALAVELAASPQKLASIKQRLAGNRLTAPLFDAGLFARHIEAAYTAMHERYQADLPPDHIYVSSGIPGSAGAQGLPARTGG